MNEIERIIELENQIQNLIEELESLVDVKEIPKIIKAGIIQQIYLSREFIEKKYSLDKTKELKIIEMMQLFEMLEVMLEGGNSINPDSFIRSAIQLTIGKNEMNVCEHENEKMYQGDGFVYVTCKDCGETL